ncbi:hypothetical protein BACI349Y_30071 [Bacillus sp. 349Y]|nr:hypothetical protein BACI349Y_30071 [Bacillus sp. 349Y]
MLQSIHMGGVRFFLKVSRQALFSGMSQPGTIIIVKRDESLILKHSNATVKVLPF